VAKIAGATASLVALLSVLTMLVPATVANATTTTTTITTSPTPAGTTTTSVAPSATAQNLSCAEQIVSSWTTSQLVNETLVVSVNVANVGAMVPAARAGYGGLLLFGSSAPATLAKTLALVQARSLDTYPLMVMTDEEGGGVQRLTNIIGSIPWAQTMGKNLSPSRIKAEGVRIGAALLAAGVNVDLAPVLDVDGRAVEPGASNPDGFRSFSGNPSVVARDGTAFMSGLQSSSVTAIVKHFPGLGGSSRNTDYGPASTLPWSVLQKNGLVPFETAIANGAKGVMLSNASIPGLTSLPASLSLVVVQQLRRTLGFQGLIMTDSLSAGAISALHLSVAEAALKALQAGDNMVLFGSATSPTASLNAAALVSTSLASAVASGALQRSTLQTDAAHVLATRNVLSC